MSRMTCSAGALVVETTDFWLICTLLRVTQSQKSSTPQPAPDVSWALTPNSKQAADRFLAGLDRSGPLRSRGLTAAPTRGAGGFLFRALDLHRAAGKVL